MYLGEICVKTPTSKFGVHMHILEVVKVHWLADECRAKWAQDGHVESKVLRHLKRTDWCNLPRIESILEVAGTFRFYTL